MELDVGNADGVTTKLLDEDTSDPLLNELNALLNSEGIDRVFPPLDGTAFYFSICRINHSCCPNVIVLYQGESVSSSQSASPSKGLVAKLTALRPITAGEELLQSYIDQSLGFEARSAALADYGIVCSCQKCVDRV